MLVFGGVAAQHLAAGLTNSQMDPAIARSQALFTPKYGVISFRNQVFQRHSIQMLAGHRILLCVDELGAYPQAFLLNLLIVVMHIEQRSRSVLALPSL
jgi:hypothetical protein